MRCIKCDKRIKNEGCIKLAKNNICQVGHTHLMGVFDGITAHTQPKSDQNTKTTLSALM